MRQKYAAILKVRAVIEAAGSNKRLAQSLRSGGAGTVQTHGFDLSPGELAALDDVLNGTQNSPYSSPPPGWPDMLQDIRKLWLSVP